MTRLRSRSKPARPYIWRLIILILLTVPSTLPEFQCGGKAVGDGLLVVADAGGEGAQAGLFVGFDGGEPGFQVAAAGAGGHHLGEGGDVPGERIDVRAAGADGLDLSLLVWLEVVGAGQQPAGDLTGLRDCRGRAGRGECLPEWPDVAADGLLAAGPAALP